MHYFTYLIIGLILLFLPGCTKELKDPLITWDNPADIVFGTIIDSVQCNATADVPGEFFYQEMGTRMPVGTNQDLTANFVPTDKTTFNSVTKTVKINVLPATIEFNPNISYGTLSDVEGNMYKTVTIGTQTWMAENLKTTKYNNGNPIPEIEDNNAWMNSNTPAYCWNYNDSASFYSIYGTLYNWHTVNTGDLCPSGWHVPTNDEWMDLRDYLINNDYGTTLREAIAKSLASVSGWEIYIPANYIEKYDSVGIIGSYDYPQKRNVTGFSAMPGGWRDAADGVFKGDVQEGRWWSTTEFNDAGNGNWVLTAELYYVDLFLFNPLVDKKCGYSVRCIKD